MKTIYTSQIIVNHVHNGITMRSKVGYARVLHDKKSAIVITEIGIDEGVISFAGVSHNHMPMIKPDMEIVRRLVPQVNQLCAHKNRNPYEVIKEVVETQLELEKHINECLISASQDDIDDFFA